MEKNNIMAHLQRMLKQLAAPTTKDAYSDLEKNRKYSISKFKITTHEKYGKSIGMEFSDENSKKFVFPPKRFLSLIENIDEMNKEIDSGKKWLFVWEGPVQQSNCVRIFSQL